MPGAETIATNATRLRLDRDLTQEALARKAYLSRVALGTLDLANRGDTAAAWPTG